MPLVVCETTVAITTHLREYIDEADLNYSGHWPRRRSLCDAEIAWDTKIPVTSARCTDCRAKAGLGPYREKQVR